MYRRPLESYFVCATPRSGSTLLCHLLAETGVAGRPEEYFEALAHSGVPRYPDEFFDLAELPELVAELRGRRPDQRPAREWSRERYADYLDWAIGTGTTPNGVFGAKLMWDYLGDFAALLRTLPGHAAAPLPELLGDVFGHISHVRVVREDKVRQAVSLWKAVQTSTWRREAGDPPDAQAPQRFDARAIGHLVSRLEEHDRAWSAYFAAAGVEPLVIVYEDLAPDPESAVRAVLDWIGVGVPADFVAPQPRLERQADARSEDWVRRFRELESPVRA